MAGYKDPSDGCQGEFFMGMSEDDYRKYSTIV